MKLYTILEHQLKKEPNFVTDNGELKKWVVLNKAQNFDEELIALLLQEPTLKEKFFKEIAGVTVFNQNLFVQFLEQKNYLNDSYTQYKNKVGLTIDGKYLKQRNEVALVWPFKDCILEGGQSREEDKREEIFFNEILAQDEITQLLEPKVLTNAKRIDKDGEKPLEQFNRDAERNRKRGLPEDTITDNLIIKGNNLLALHSLKKEFAGKVKLIYIDPPYYFNKSKTVDSFTYNSNFKLSTWLVFMKNRLAEAKQMLTESGVIFISIDDGGQAHLKIILDEIFGTENFIANLPTVMNLKGNNDEYAFAGTHEYTLVYAKNKPKSVFYEFPIDAENMLKDWEEDEIGYFKKGAPMRATGAEDRREDRPEMFYPFLIKEDEITTVEDVEFKKIYDKNRKTFDDDYIEQLRIKYESLGFEFVLPKADEYWGRWRWGYSIKNKNRLQYDVIVNKSGNNITLYKKQRPELGELPSKKPKTIFYKPEYSSGNGTAQIKELFGEKVFSNPKPLELIKDFILIGSANDDIVLDYHAGSGTTAHAVLELNKEDGGNRQFIMVEQMDYIETVTCKRVQKVIEQNGNSSFIYLELKKYNQAFIEQIEVAKDTETLLQIWEQMKAKSFLNYNVDIKKQEEHIEEFKTLTLKEQKQHLCEILDKNQLYVNLSSLNDADFACTEEEKRLNRDFYKMK
jgi:adenine-specific DNA-methyltransferase